LILRFFRLLRFNGTPLSFDDPLLLLGSLAFLRLRPFALQSTTLKIISRVSGVLNMMNLE